MCRAQNITSHKVIMMMTRKACCIKIIHIMLSSSWFIEIWALCVFLATTFFFCICNNLTNNCVIHTFLLSTHFSIQFQFCLIFWSIESQMFLKCCLLHLGILPSHVVFCVYLYSYLRLALLILWSIFHYDFNFHCN